VLTSSIRDLAGNQLVQTVVPFSTGGTTDTAPPEVSYTIPADGAVDVSPNAIIRVVFNEGMDTNSVIPASFARSFRHRSRCMNLINTRML